MSPERARSQKKYHSQREQRFAHKNHPQFLIFFARRTNKSHEASPLLRTIAFMAIKSLQEIFSQYDIRMIFSCQDKRRVLESHVKPICKTLARRHEDRLESSSSPGSVDRGKASTAIRNVADAFPRIDP
jgi:hypothetical protein